MDVRGHHSLGHQCHKPPHHIQGYLILCLSLSHEWGSLKAGAVSPEPAQYLTQLEDLLEKKGQSPNRGLDTLALDQFYRGVTLDQSMLLSRPLSLHP